MRGPKELNKWVVMFQWKYQEHSVEIFGYGRTKKEAIQAAERQSITQDDAPTSKRAFHISYEDKGKL